MASLLFPNQPRLTDTAAPLRYPMFLMPTETFLQQKIMKTHQEVHEKGDVVEHTTEMVGRVVFLSHQWLGYKRSD